MKTGIVKSYNIVYGFGFIKEFISQKDFYFDDAGLKETIKENDKVTFELKDGENGVNAVDIRQA